MISAMLGGVDDATQAIMRFFGRQSNTPAAPYDSPQGLVAALRDPTTEASGVARMRKMHYGLYYGENSRTMFSGLAEGELLRKGKGFGGAIFGRPVKGFSVGMSHFTGAMPFIPIQAFAESAFAPRGHKMSAMVGGAAKGLFYALGDVVGTLVAGPVAGFALGAATEHIGHYVEEGVQMLHDFNRSVKHINMGGNYNDTETAYTMRQVAAREMGASVMNARQYLGKEALLMHQ